MGKPQHPKIAKQPAEIQPYLDAGFWGKEFKGNISLPRMSPGSVTKKDQRFARRLIRAGLKNELAYTPYPDISFDSSPLSYNSFGRGTALKVGIVRLICKPGMLDTLLTDEAQTSQPSLSNLEYEPQVIRGNSAEVRLDIYEGIVVPALPRRHVLQYICRNRRRDRHQVINTDDRNTLVAETTWRTRDHLAGIESIERVVGMQAYTVAERDETHQLGFHAINHT